MGNARLHSRRSSMKSSRPGSAHWRSSKTITTVPRGREPLEERAPGREELRRVDRAGVDPEEREEGRLDPAPLGLARGRAPRRSRRPSSGSSRSSSVSTRPARRRTISPSAQNVIPSPYAGLRPSCHQIGSTSPSRYFSSSQARRVLPIPPIPVTDTRRARRSRPVAWKRSLSRRSSSSRPTKGASSVSARLRPPRSATTRRARQAGTGVALALERLLAGCLEGDRPARGTLGRLADEDGARWRRPTGGGWPCSTRSPATIPWPSRRW